jgi:DNA topoisomerase-1
MKLVIVESPSKSKTISKYLGDGFVVRASVGHVRDLPKSSKKAIDIEAGFVPNYEIVAKKQAIIDEIRKVAEKADGILLATDPDREGEAIAWHLKELLTKKSLGGDISANKIKRVSFHEITKEAVTEALAHPREIDEHLREAQEARRVLDRLVGYDLSGIVWKKVRYGLSAGRVQSPALRIIMEREREIRAFKPEDFWVIVGQFKTEKSDSLTLTCSKEPRDKKEVDSIIDIAKKDPWVITAVEESEVKRSPKAPFITSTLQQTASTRLGFSPSRTMGIAQKLYEAGHITYMRTDSTNLSQQALGMIAWTVEKEYGKMYHQFRTFTAKSKNAQEAHEAVRPTKFNKASAGANDEQKRLYRLIWQRAVASQMSDAVMARTKITANVRGQKLEARSLKLEEKREQKNDFPDPKFQAPSSKLLAPSSNLPDFEATGSRVLFDGWLKADPESVGEEVNLPKCAADEKLDLQSIGAEGKQTQPPPRYTEAGLIRELEKRGIGRPSTYASITKTIEDRGYVEKEGRSLKPTDTGDVVSSFLEEYFPTYVSDTFTAESRE